MVSKHVLYKNLLWKKFELIRIYILPDQANSSIFQHFWQFYECSWLCGAALISHLTNQSHKSTDATNQITALKPVFSMLQADASLLINQPMHYFEGKCLSSLCLTWYFILLCWRHISLCFISFFIGKIFFESLRKKCEKSKSLQWHPWLLWRKAGQMKHC